MGVNHVNDVQEDLLNRQAVVEHDGASLDAMRTAVDDAGYEVIGTA